MIDTKRIEKLNKLFNKVKIGLLVKGSVFITTVGFNLKFKWDEKIPTAGTDGVYILFNPDFFESLTKEERIFVYAHEIYHVVFMHMIRGQSKDKQKYNAAADYVINILLKDANYTIPKDALIKANYRGWSTEQVYDDLPDSPPLPPMMDILEPGEAAGDTKDQTIDDVQTSIEDIVLRAVTASKMSSDEAGAIPGEIEQALDKLINPVLDWKSILANFMNATQKEDYSWKRPNRRYLSNRLYLPIQHSEKLDILTFAIDTSCSVSDEMMIEMFSEINYIHQTMKPDMLHIIVFDTQIRKTWEITQDDDIQDIVIKGRGGTSFTWINDYCKKNKPEALIVFSDMQCTPLENDPGCSLLWIAYDCSDNFTVPFGELTHYKPMV